MYSTDKSIPCKVYQHINGKTYHAVKRCTPTWSQVRGEVVESDNPIANGTIALFPVNPKTGRAWQAARYFKQSDVKWIDQINV